MQSLKSFLLSFSFSFFCLSLIVMATVLWVSPFARPQEAPAQSYISIPEEEDSITVFAVLAEESASCFSVISFQPRAGTVALWTFPPDTVINGEILGSVWAENPALAMNLLSAYLELPIERWAILQNQDVVELVDLFGPVSVTLTQPLTWHQASLSVTLEPGLHQLNGEEILHYLQASPDPQEYARRAAVLLQQLINQAMPLAASEQAQTLFQQLLEHMETDLSSADYDRCHNSIAFMAQLVNNPAVIQ